MPAAKTPENGRKRGRFAGPTGTLSVTVPADLLAEIERRAAADLRSPSEWVAVHLIRTITPEPS